MKLSVVLATYNEEENISACIESVKDFAAEVIVVDGSSTDKTVELAKKLGAKVYVTDNKPLFHINKQMAINRASKDWILQLDADELVSKNLQHEIISVTNNNTHNGYWIPRKNYFLGRFLMKGGVYPDYTLRLYRRGKGKLPQKDVHEQAIVEGSAGYLEQPLIHMADKSFKRYLLRYSRYTTLLATQLLDQKVKPSIMMGIQYLILKPLHWFLLSYIRHKGFMDSWQGFIFSFFSALRFPVSYYKFCQLYESRAR